MSRPSSGNRPAANSYWVVAGRFAAGAYPGAQEPGMAAAKLRALLEAGIDHFIDLTEPGELAPYADVVEDEASRLGVSVGYERHPIADGSVPSSPVAMTEILDAIDCAVNDGKTVYVHCWGGAGRTGTVVGCWLRRSGRTGDEALRQLAGWFQGMHKSYRVPPRRSPETREQRAYVRQWAEPPRESRPR